MVSSLVDMNHLQRRAAVPLASGDARRERTLGCQCWSCLLRFSSDYIVQLSQTEVLGFHNHALSFRQPYLAVSWRRRLISHLASTGYDKTSHPRFYHRHPTSPLRLGFVLGDPRISVTVSRRAVCVLASHRSRAAGRPS